MTEIEFPTSVCPDREAGKEHEPHRIAGTWRTECPGVEHADDAAPAEFREYPTHCRHGRFLSDRCDACGHSRQLILGSPLGSASNPCGCGNGDMLMPCEHWRAIGRTG